MKKFGITGLLFSMLAAIALLNCGTSPCETLKTDALACCDKETGTAKSSCESTINSAISGLESASGGDDACQQAIDSKTYTSCTAN